MEIVINTSLTLSVKRCETRRPGGLDSRQAKLASGCYRSAQYQL